MHQKRTAIITDANMHVGPDLARELASNHNLVLGEPAVGLVEEVTGLGADASGLDGVADLSDPESIKKLVEHAPCEIWAVGRGLYSNRSNHYR